MTFPGKRCGPATQLSGGGRFRRTRCFFLLGLDGVGCPGYGEEDAGEEV